MTRNYIIFNFVILFLWSLNLNRALVTELLLLLLPSLSNGFFLCTTIGNPRRTLCFKLTLVSCAGLPRKQRSKMSKARWSSRRHTKLQNWCARLMDHSFLFFHDVANENASSFCFTLGSSKFVFCLSKSYALESLTVSSFDLQDL